MMNLIESHFTEVGTGNLVYGINKYGVNLI